MKVYEALKEMIENGKTIKQKGSEECSYRLGKASWDVNPVILEKFSYRDHWEIKNALWFYNGDLSTEWEVVKEAE